MSIAHSLRWLRATPADRRLLPEGRFSGPMPWVIAIMMFLTVLAMAAGIALQSAAQSMGDDMAGRLTVQLPEANAARREGQSRALLIELRRMTAVDHVTRVSDAELQKLVEPWLGDAGREADLPMPALLDVTLQKGSERQIAEIRSTILAIAPGARVEAHAQWLGPLASLLSALRWLALFLILLMLVATGAVIVMAARASLNSNRSTIDILHLLGSTDVQVAHLFQRRIALDVLFGGLLGLVTGVGVLLLLGLLMQGIGSALLESAGLGWGGWLLLALLPLAATGLAMIVTRFTILSILRKTL